MGSLQSIMEEGKYRRFKKLRQFEKAQKEQQELQKTKIEMKKFIKIAKRKNSSLKISKEQILTFGASGLAGATITGFLFKSLILAGAGGVATGLLCKAQLSQKLKQ